MAHAEGAQRRAHANDDGEDAGRYANKKQKRSHGEWRDIGKNGIAHHVTEAAQPEEGQSVPVPIAPPTASSLRLVNVLQQALHQDWHHNTFPFEDYVKQEQGLRLDHESTICPTFLKEGKCPLGNACPKRHVPLFQPPHSSASHNRDGTKRTVCKHWLRGLCKKGDGCDYLHEYDMRTMPECRFFATFGYCDMSSGTERECLYLHRDPKTKRRECEEYNRGFCQKGPSCPKKHIRRVICPHYLAGFCPKGKDCQRGHPKVSRPSVESRRNSLIQTVRPMTAEEAFAPPPHLRDRQPYRSGPGGGTGGEMGGRDYHRMTGADDHEGSRRTGMNAFSQQGGARQWGNQRGEQISQSGMPPAQGMPPPTLPPGLQHLAQQGGLTPSQSGSDLGTPGPAGGEDAFSVIPGFGNANAATSFAMTQQMQQQQQVIRGTPPFNGAGFDGGAGGHGAVAGASAGGPGGRPPRKFLKDLSEVLCFKCGELGHFANMCPNPNKPGQRGRGQERGRGGAPLERGGGHHGGAGSFTGGPPSH